jgi:hypothetical protein
MQAKSGCSGFPDSGFARTKEKHWKKINLLSVLSKGEQRVILL